MAEQNAPPADAIEFLQKNPQFTDKFDEKYGEGVAATYLITPGEDQLPTVTPEGEPVDVAATEPQPGAQPLKEQPPGAPFPFPTAGVDFKVEKPPVFVASDAAKAVPGGVIASFENQGDLVTQFVEWAGSGKIPLGVTWDKETIEAMGGDGDLSLIFESRFLDDPVFGRVGTPDAVLESRESIVGGMVQGVTQFVTSFVTAGKLLGPVKSGVGSSGTARVLSASAQGAGAGFIGFDPQEPRLSDFVQSFPYLENPITDYLAADPEDGEVEGRLKSALEEVFVGALAEGLFSIIRHTRRSRQLRLEGKPAEATLERAKLAEEIGEDLGVGTPGKTKTIVEKAVTPSVRTVRDVGRIDEAIKIAKLTADDFDTESAGQWFNWDKYAGGDDLKAMMQAAQGEAEALLKRISAEGVQSQGIVVREAARYLSETLDMGLERVMEGFMKQAESAKELPRSIIAGKMMVQSLAADMKRLASLVDQGHGNVRIELQIGRRLDMMEDMVAFVKGLSRQTARALSVHQKVIGPGPGAKELSVGEIMDELARWGGSESIRIRARRISAGLGGSRSVWKNSKKTLFRKIVDIHNEFFVNSILSGYKTQLVNILSNSVQSVLVPVEKMIGAVAMRDKTMLKEGYLQFRHMASAARDAVKMSAVAMRTGRNILDPHISKYEIPLHAIDSSKDGVIGSMLRGTGSLVRIPMRLLMSGDEFFSQLNFRSELRAKIEVEGWAKFGKDSARRIAWMADEWDKAWTSEKEIAWRDIAKRDTGQFTDLPSANIARADMPGGPNLRAEQGLRNSREAIFTTDLRDHPSWTGGKTFGAAFSDFVNSVPYLRPLAPFIRTPTNLIRTWAMHSPGLNLLYKQWWDDIAAGGERKAKAIGKVATGTAFYTAAYEMAMSGRLTGRGPEDKSERERLQDTGWQPYSFIFVDETTDEKTYIQYSRFDPIGMFFGMTADLHYASNHTSEADMEIMAGAAFHSLLSNMENKAYFKGMSDALTAAFESEDRMATWARKYFAGYVPTFIPETGKGLGVGFDDTMKVQQGMFDGVIAKLPWWNAELPPKRSWVTGQPMRYEDTVMFPDTLSPFIVRSGVDSPALEMLAEVEHGFQPPASIFGNVDIKKENPELYDRLLQLTARPRKGMRSLVERLDIVMKRSNFDVEKEKALLGAGAPGSQIAPIIEDYRAKARTQLLRENPWLRDLERKWNRTEIKARRGDAEALKELEKFDQNK